MVFNSQTIHGLDWVVDGMVGVGCYSVDGATLEPNATERVGCCNCWAHVWDVAGMLAVGC